VSRKIHLVGSIGLDTVDDVFATVGALLGDRLKRVPDGEPGGRRLWISWQYPLLRANPFLQVGTTPGGALGFRALRVADGVAAAEVRFGELGYAREARASYRDFCAAREAGKLPRDIRFQVCLPTPFAVISPFCEPDQVALILPAYEAAMLREVAALAAAIPHRDLAIQWDVCIEMVIWDGRWQVKPFPGIERVFAGTFARLAAAVPADVDLGFHLCYGDLDAKHFIEPLDTRKMVELANLITAAAARPIAFLHLPVPIARDDDAFYAPLHDLVRDGGTELYLGLVHAADGVAGTARRIAAATRHVADFGIATECGIARGRTPGLVDDILRVHAAAAA
jgi:hypothetical protein